MSRARYYAVRSIKTVFLLWLVLTLLFFFFRLMPGDFTDFLIYQGASEDAIRQIEEKWGLNDPLYIQYWRYLTNFVQLDVGTSLQARKPVWEFVKFKLLNTMLLTAPGITIGYILGGIIGSYIGDKRGSRIERGTITVLTFVGAFPGFFTGIVMIIVFGVWLDIFPTGGMMSVETTSQFKDAAWWRPYLTQDFAWHYILPLATIVIRLTFGPTLIMRTSIVEVMGQDFAYYQKVSGLPYVRRLRHLARHAVLPLITLYPVSMVRAVSGLVLIELVFNWPGIGWALVQAVAFRDFPVVQFIFFLAAALVIVSNFGVDILYGVIDPRISVEDQ